MGALSPAKPRHLWSAPRVRVAPADGALLPPRALGAPPARPSDELRRFILRADVGPSPHHESCRARRPGATAMTSPAHEAQMCPRAQTNCFLRAA